MHSQAHLQLSCHARPRLPTQVRSAVNGDRYQHSTAACCSGRSASAAASTSGSRWQSQLPFGQKAAGSVRCSSSTVPAPTADTAGPPGGSGGDGSGGFGGGGNDAGEGEGEGEGDDEDLLSLEQAERIAASSGIKLPSDFAAVAAAEGLRRGALSAYAALQHTALLGWLARVSKAARNRLLADPRYLFIVVSEVLIDSGCATVAEVRKRGPDFWDEFEFYLSDLVVGCVLDVVLVSLMAPTASLGARKPAAKSRLQRALAGVPSAVFEPNRPGARYGAGARVACVGVKFLEYSLAGMVCGFVGQGIANQLMYLKRHYQPGAEGDRVLDVPPLGMSALTWGLFMGASSNLRYQAVFGLERVVDKTIARRVPQVAYATSFLLRFLNNVIGGENFIDMARWTGIQ